MSGFRVRRHSLLAHLRRFADSLVADIGLIALLLSPAAAGQVFDPHEGADLRLVAEQAELLSASIAAPDDVAQPSALRKFR